MATVIPIDQLAPMLRALPSLPRPVLARLTERLIDRLDEIDGDADTEDDDPKEEDDHSLDLADDGEPEGWAFFEPPSRPPDGARKSREAHIHRIRGTRCVPIHRRRRRWAGDTAVEVGRHALVIEPKVPSLRSLRRRHQQLRGKRRR